MWLMPCLSSTSRARSATSWVTLPRAAAPKRMRLLWWPVRPKGASAIAILDTNLAAQVIAITGAAGGVGSILARGLQLPGRDLRLLDIRPAPGCEVLDVRD